MKKGWTLVAVLFVVIVIGLVALIVVPAPKANPPVTSGTTTATTTTATSTSLLSDTIVVTAPVSGATIASPLTITGKARGTFYFEATFPVKLKDASGTIIAEGHATAQSNWMTTDFVPFTATLTFLAPASGSVGSLVLLNDNPSGDPAKQLELAIPVAF